MPFSKNLYYIETSQLFYFANQLISFYIIRTFKEIFFQIDYTDCCQVLFAYQANLNKLIHFYSS